MFIKQPLMNSWVWYWSTNYRWIDSTNYLNGSHFHVGRCPTMKKPWTKEETSAVERSMSRKFIEKFTVPGKNDCVACINANPEALKERDWKAVKYHVKNKITALKRKAFSHSPCLGGFRGIYFLFLVVCGRPF